mmetsp:Transcript_92561/g.164592  ORF Transcript_92561/g.164592 Transcript_92561/m.164592 type:complete len:1016 (+) Transcript_92561:82-3129(+)
MTWWPPLVFAAVLSIVHVNAATSQLVRRADLHSLSLRYHRPQQSQDLEQGLEKEDRNVALMTEVIGAQGVLLQKDEDESVADFQASDGFLSGAPVHSSLLAAGRASGGRGIPGQDQIEGSAINGGEAMQVPAAAETSHSADKAGDITGEGVQSAVGGENTFDLLNRTQDYAIRSPRRSTRNETKSLPAGEGTKTVPKPCPAPKLSPPPPPPPPPPPAPAKPAKPAEPPQASKDPPCTTSTAMTWTRTTTTVTATKTTTSMTTPCAEDGNESSTAIEVNWKSFGSSGVQIFANFSDETPGATMPDQGFPGRLNWIIKLPEEWTDSQIQELADQFPTLDKFSGHPAEGGLSILIVWADKDELALALHEVRGALYAEMDVELEGFQDAVLDVQEGLQKKNAVPWGLDRIDSEAELDGVYLPGSPEAGRGVHVYVVDSGIKATHGQFGGRAVPSIEVHDSHVKVCRSTDSQCASDKVGHGTRIASTIGGTTLGVAQGAWLHAVKITNDFGHGKLSSFLIALDWILVNGDHPAVVSTSFQTISKSHNSRILRDAVNKAHQSNIPVVVPAGDTDGDACAVSPAYVPAAVTVGASAIDDKIAIFSNWGRCLDIFAPGESIKVATHLSDNSYAVVSGTAAAAAHVAGAMAVFFGIYPDSSLTEATDMLLNSAFTLDKSYQHDSPNKLLSMAFATGMKPIIIGASDAPKKDESPKFRKKCVKAPQNMRCAENAGDYGQRLGWDHFKDSFRITVDGAQVCAERIDNSENYFLPSAKYSADVFDEGGWNMNLVAICQSREVVPPSDTWVFEDLGGTDSLCAGANPRDRKSIYFLLYQEVFDKNECEKLCKSQNGCKGYSFLPGHECEVWLRDINSYVKYPREYETDSIFATCSRFVGRGRSGKGFLHLASHPKKCLDVVDDGSGKSRILRASDCSMDKTWQKFSWHGVGSISISGEPSTCLTASGQQVILNTCNNLQSQLLTFQGTGHIRLASRNSSLLNHCIATDGRGVHLEECDPTAPEQQFFY